MPGCLNCGADLTGPFCARCGQRDVPPHPTVKELAGDAYGELVGWDGKLARTLVLLVRSPGTLTREILDGRRAAYISPVRLYLSCSLVYFLVSAWVPAPDIARTFDVGVGVASGASLTPRSPSDAAIAQAMSRGLSNLEPAQRALVEEAITGQPAFIRPLLRALVTDPARLRQRAADAMPRVLFVMIPALAGVLAFFYRGRHFPEHLYFAVLFQALVFLVLTVQSLTGLAGTIVALAAGQGGAGIVIAGCGVVAQRRVYGGSWVAAVLKGAGVAVIYLLLWSAVVLGVTLWASA